MHEEITTQIDIDQCTSIMDISPQITRALRHFNEHGNKYTNECRNNCLIKPHCKHYGCDPFPRDLLAGVSNDNEDDLASLNKFKTKFCEKCRMDIVADIENDKKEERYKLGLATEDINAVQFTGRMNLGSIPSYRHVNCKRNWYFNSFEIEPKQAWTKVRK